METISIRESDGNIVTLEAYSSLRSTAKLIKKYANAGKPDRYIVFAEKRLRADGTEESGVFMSILLRPSFFPSQASLLGCMTGTAMITALEEHTSSHLGLGWVNDIYCDGVKIGSASIEGKLDDFKAYEYLIINIALKLDPKHFPPRLTDLIVEVFESGKSSISLIIARNIITKFFRFYANLKSSAKFMDIYTAKFILKGNKVKDDFEGKKRRFKVVGVDTTTGALLINLPKISGEYPIYSLSTVTTPKRVKVNKKQKA